MSENQNIEWKTSWRDDCLQWICAFANAQGGTLEIGKNDKGGVVGLKNAGRLLEEIPNKTRDILGIIVDVNLRSDTAGEYLEIIVNPSSSPISCKGEYYYRSGSTRQALKGAALDNFLLRKTGRHWDSVTVPRVTLEDLDGKVLENFRKFAVRSERLSQDIQDESAAVLIDRLRLQEGGFLKRAAVLLFHSDPERFVTGAFVKIGYFRSNADLLFQDEVHGDLFTQVEKTMDLLLTKYLRALISYEGIYRVETYPVPKEALREAVLNAIAHKDYGSAIPIQISVYEDKIMLWNSGQLPPDWTVEHLIRKHQSNPFNPDVANAFYRAGMIEEWGRGIERIMDACMTSDLPAPEWQYDSTGLWVKFAFRHTGAAADVSRVVTEQAGAGPGPGWDQVKGGLKPIQGQAGPKSVPSRGQVDVLRECLKPSSMQELMRAAGRSNRTRFSDQMLRPLLDAGLVEMTIPGKPRSSRQRYRITDKGLAALAAVQKEVE